jgi:hypothetical protein
VTRRPPRAKTYTTLPELKAGTLDYCREDWLQRTGKEWTDEGVDGARAALDEELTDIPAAHRALVEAFRAASDLVKRRRDDQRADPLRDFLATLSDKTESWLRIFGEMSDLGWNEAPPDGRTRLVLYELSAGRDDDPARLARLSLLLGYFTREDADGIKLPAKVSTVVDHERKAMVRAVTRAHAWLASQKLERVRRA